MQGHISVSVLQEVMVLGMVYNMYIYHIKNSLQVDIDVSRAPYDIGNMDVVYAIAICCISTPKAHMCLECQCSHIKCDGLAFSLVILRYASMIWMVHT